MLIFQPLLPWYLVRCFQPSVTLYLELVASTGLVDLPRWLWSVSLVHYICFVVYRAFGPGDGIRPGYYLPDCSKLIDPQAAHWKYAWIERGVSGGVDAVGLPCITLSAWFLEALAASTNKLLLCSGNDRGRDRECFIAGPYVATVKEFRSFLLQVLLDQSNQQTHYWERRWSLASTSAADLHIFCAAFSDSRVRLVTFWFLLLLCPS